MQRPRDRARGHVWRDVEATTGFEPVITVLQTAPLGHLGTSPQMRVAGPRGFEPRFTDPKSGVLPLDEGPAVGARNRPSPGVRDPRQSIPRRGVERKTGLEPATLTLAR